MSPEDPPRPGGREEETVGDILNDIGDLVGQIITDEVAEARLKDLLDKAKRPAPLT